MKSKVIILGGDGGSGKSTLAKQLASKLKYRRIYGGMILRELAVDKGFCDFNQGSTKPKFNEVAFLKFLKEYIPNHPEADLKVDATLLEEAIQERIVIESRTLTPIVKRLGLNYLGIWVTAEEKVRAQRICQREHERGTRFTVEEMMTINRTRINEDRKRYLALYGFDLFKVEKYYDLIFDTTQIPEKDMLSHLLAQMKRKNL